MRQAIGKTMAYSKSTIPHFYVAGEIDMTDAEIWRKNLAETDGIALSVTDLFLKAAADALTPIPGPECQSGMARLRSSCTTRSTSA